MNEPAESTRTKLVIAAAEVFAAKGYKAATIREICTTAGANVAAVNYHFGDKESLYNAVLESMFGDSAYSGHMPEIAETDEPPEERMRQMLKVFAHQVYECKAPEDNKDLGSIYRMEMVNPSPAFQTMMQRYIRRDASALVKVVGDMLGPNADERRVMDCAAGIAGQILYFAMMRPVAEMLDPNYRKRDDFIEHLAEHVAVFSIAGIKAVKDELVDKGEGRAELRPGYTEGRQ